MEWVRGVAAVGKPQMIEVGVGEGEGGRAEESGEGQIVGRVGEGGEGVEQVADFGPVIESFSGNGDEGDAGGFERVFVNGEGGGGAEEKGNVAPFEFFLRAPFVE